MHFAIVIPTYKRQVKLTRCIESILKQTHQDFNIYPMCDNNDIESFKYISQKYRDIDKVYPFVVLDHQYVMGCWNLFTRDQDTFDLIKDAMVWIVDDVELLPDCLEKLNATFLKNFPDNDGMVGISQLYPLLQAEVTWRENGQCAIGKEFINRFPQRQVCCTDYIHFYQDEEVLEYARSINKFKLSDAQLIHYHPAFYKNEMDETHKIPRDDVRMKDTMTYNKRKKRGLIWGKSWILINDQN